jgi:hypothetical protein
MVRIVCQGVTGDLSTEIKSSSIAGEIGLLNASKSMYSEAFVRYQASVFQHMFLRLLERLNSRASPNCNSLGTLACIDGSLIPAVQSMS